MPPEVKAARSIVVGVGMEMDVCVGVFWDE
jgi:hypothetical protein